MTHSFDLSSDPIMKCDMDPPVLVPQWPLGQLQSWTGSSLSGDEPVDWLYLGFSPSDPEELWMVPADAMPQLGPDDHWVAPAPGPHISSLAIRLPLAQSLPVSRAPEFQPLCTISPDQASSLRERLLRDPPPASTHTPDHLHSVHSLLWHQDLDLPYATWIDLVATESRRLASPGLADFPPLLPPDPDFDERLSQALSSYAASDALPSQELIDLIRAETHHPELGRITRYLAPNSWTLVVAVDNHDHFTEANMGPYNLKSHSLGFMLTKTQALTAMKRGAHASVCLRSTTHDYLVAFPRLGSATQVGKNKNADG